MIVHVVTDPNPCGFSRGNSERWCWGRAVHQDRHALRACHLLLLICNREIDVGLPIATMASEAGAMALVRTLGVFGVSMIAQH